MFSYIFIIYSIDVSVIENCLFEMYGYFGIIRLIKGCLFLIRKVSKGIQIPVLTFVHKHKSGILFLIFRTELNCFFIHSTQGLKEKRYRQQTRSMFLVEKGMFRLSVHYIITTPSYRVQFILFF